jgi:hypothetical protein
MLEDYIGKMERLGRAGASGEISGATSINVIPKVEEAELST